MALSLWLGYFFIKFQHIIAYYLGYMPSGLPGSGLGYGKAFTFYQVQGAYWVYVALLMWTHVRYFGGSLDFLSLDGWGAFLWTKISFSLLTQNFRQRCLCKTTMLG